MNRMGIAINDGKRVLAYSAPRITGPIPQYPMNAKRPQNAVFPDCRQRLVLSNEVMSLFFFCQIKS